MADNLCGPSNALQSFQKHASTDRTLQEDRLAHRPSPSRGFRSQPGPNAGALNREFQAFQAGRPMLDPHGFAPQSHSTPPQAQYQSGPPAWAHEFQRMNMSAATPQYQPYQFNRQLPHGHPTAEWHQEFARQHVQNPERNLPHSASHHGTPSQYPTMSMPYSGMQMSPQPYMVGAGMMQNQQFLQPVERFDGEAFARAFDEAAKFQSTISETEYQQKNDVKKADFYQQNDAGENVVSKYQNKEVMEVRYQNANAATHQAEVPFASRSKRVDEVHEFFDKLHFDIKQENSQQNDVATPQAETSSRAQPLSLNQSTTINTSSEQFSATETDSTIQDASSRLAFQGKIGADTIPPSESQAVAISPAHLEQQQPQQRSQHDSLSQAAAMVLRGVGEEVNQNKKFQNSAFLGLMRKFKDKEATVDGDKLVNREGASMASQPINGLASGGPGGSGIAGASMQPTAAVVQPSDTNFTNASA